MSFCCHSLSTEQKNYVEILKKNQGVFDRGKGELEDAKGREHESIITSEMAFRMLSNCFYHNQSSPIFCRQEKGVAQSILVLDIRRTVSIKVEKPKEPVGTFQICFWYILFPST